MKAVLYRINDNDKIDNTEGSCLNSTGNTLFMHFRRLDGEPKIFSNKVNDSRRKSMSSLDPIYVSRITHVN